MPYIKLVRKDALRLRVSALHTPSSQNKFKIEKDDVLDEGDITTFVQALDDIHSVAQATISAADRNLRLMEDCTRELRTSVNILRWSNGFAAAQKPENESAPTS